MKPKNKYQKHLIELSKKLPKISKPQQKWAFDNCFPKLAYRTKKHYTCFECAHQWPNISNDQVCPNCGSTFELLSNKARSYSEKEYFAILSVVGGFQVVRNFYVSKYCKVGKEAEYFICEVVQQWFDQSGKYTIIAIRTASTFFSGSNWAFGSPFEIRNDHNRYRTYPFVYPRQKVLPTITRNGFSGNLEGFSAVDLFPALLTNPTAETLFKAKQFSLLGYFIFRSKREILKYWPSIKICLRNNYHVSDSINWLDMLKTLEYLEKDLHNSKYICPEDQKAAHDYWMHKKDIIQERRRKQEQLKKLNQAEIEYQSAKQKFFDLKFTKKAFAVVVLDSVREFLNEGKELKHCVYTNEYYNKPDSLILSARMNDQRLETIEVSLENFEIIQSRGLHNEPSKFHNEIVSLVKRNMPKIKKRALIAV